MPVRGSPIRFIWNKHSARRGALRVCAKLVVVEELLLLGLGPLGAVLGAGLHTAVDALGVQRAADDVVTNAGQVLDTAAADHDHGVLLQVVAHAGDIGGDLVAVGQAHTGDLTQRGVRLLRGGSTNGGAHAPLLGRGQIGHKYV